MQTDRRAFLSTAAGLALVAAYPVTTVAQNSASKPTPENVAILWKEGDPGERLNLRGRITDEIGAPVVGARIYMRQADGEAVYTEQYSASLKSGKDGSYKVATVLPGQYAGDKHIHVTIEHDDFWSLSTTIVFKGDNDGDPNAIVLEESRIKGELVWQGRYDAKLERR